MKKIVISILRYSMNFTVAFTATFTMAFAGIVATTVSSVISSTARASDVRAYVLRDSIWSAPQVIVDDKAYNPHFWSGFSNLTEAMKSNPDAAHYIELSNSDHLWGTAFLWGGLVAALTYGLTSGDHFNDGTYSVLFLGGFIPGALFLDASGVNLNKAINSYNNISSISARWLPQKLMVAPTRGGAMAGLGWAF